MLAEIVWEINWLFVHVENLSVSFLGNRSVEEQEIETAKQYIIQAKQFAKQKDPSNINLAIIMYREASKILPNNEKLTLRITALENHLAMLQPEEEDENEEEEDVDKNINP